ncbi:serine hydrolase [Hymenobacter ruber]
MKVRLHFYLLGLLLLTGGQASAQQKLDVKKSLNGFDKTVAQLLKDWNVPGCGVAVVVKNKLVFAQGYGYRDLEKKLPVTPNTLFPIGSNTKLFTATAVGLLVEEGKLDWDKPVKNYVPQIQFYNDELTANITIRDMLSHRTGMSRHDNIWYNSDFSRQQLFERLKYLEPNLPLRQGYLYNNMMYAAAGHIVEQLSGQSWEEYVRTKFFEPLGMSRTVSSTEAMLKQPDFLTAYYEKHDTTTLLPYSFYTRWQGLGPAGSIISDLGDMSHWLIVQMHGGKYNSKVVVPNAIVQATMQPAALAATVPQKEFESINSMYGMGRSTSSYKGHYRTEHGGAINGVYSRVSFLPADSIGIIVFVNGAHGSPMTNILTNIVYDRVLGLPPTPWNERNLKNYRLGKATARAARKKPDTDRVPNTTPSHPLADYVGQYEDPAYGVLDISLDAGKLRFTFNHQSLPLEHYHYDRFSSADDEFFGTSSFTFAADAQGNIQQAKISMDEKEVVFIKKADAHLLDPNFLKTLAGQYELNGNTTNVMFGNKELTLSTSPMIHLDAYKNNTFRMREFSDQTVQFSLDASGNPTGFNVTQDGITTRFSRKK